MTAPIHYSLLISFSSDDLQRFRAAGSNVVIAKPLSNGIVNVAWVVFQPFQTNGISWSEQYVLYASNTDIANGAQVFPNAQTGSTVFAQTDVLYTLASWGTITGPSTSGGAAGAYSLANGYTNPKGYLTFGVMQGAIVNSETRSATPMSATATLLNSIAVMTPNPAVFLWLQPNIGSGTVATSVTGPMSQVSLTPASPSAQLAYNATTGTFYSTDGQQQVSLIAPRL